MGDMASMGTGLLTLGLYQPDYNDELLDFLDMNEKFKERIELLLQFIDYNILLLKPKEQEET